MNHKKYFQNKGFNLCVTDFKTSCKYAKAWRKAFIPDLQNQNLFSYLSKNWHEGNKALSDFIKLEDNEFIVLNSFENKPMSLLINDGKLEDFSDFRDDLIIFNNKLTWTMVFSHEQFGFGGGPYFTKKDKAEPKDTVQFKPVSQHGFDSGSSGR